MNKNCKMTIGAMLLLTTAFSAFPANAQTCAVPLPVKVSDMTNPPTSAAVWLN